MDKWLSGQHNPARFAQYLKNKAFQPKVFMTCKFVTKSEHHATSTYSTSEWKKDGTKEKQELANLVSLIQSQVTNAPLTLIDLLLIIINLGEEQDQIFNRPRLNL